MENAIKLTEKKRTYVYPSGAKIELDKVVEVVIRPSGTHRIKTEDDKLHIIAKGWIHIEIDESEWAF